jgi:prepilin-type N-terminal cleavage/methylation domain-containing protein
MQYRRGFTLIELLVVIAIIAILAGLVTQSLFSARISARNASAKDAITSLGKSVEIYRNNDQSGDKIISAVATVAGTPTGLTGTAALQTGATVAANALFKSLFVGTENFASGTSAYGTAASTTPSNAYTYTYGSYNSGTAASVALMHDSTCYILDTNTTVTPGNFHIINGTSTDLVNGVTALSAALCP